MELNDMKWNVHCTAMEGGMSHAFQLDKILTFLITVINSNIFLISCQKIFK